MATTALCTSIPPFADVTVGFVLTDLKVMENGNIVILSVGVLEGQLTREVELSFSTSSRTAQSKILHRIKCLY